MGIQKHVYDGILEIENTKTESTRDAVIGPIHDGLQTKEGAVLLEKMNTTRMIPAWSLVSLSL